jgi:hypothetical protein
MQGARALKIDIYQAIVLLLLIFVSGCFVGAEKVDLYRAVKPEELNQIKQTGTFKNLPGMAEGKYFSTNLEGAKQYAEMAEKAFGDDPYAFVKTSVPKSAITDLMKVSVDSGIDSIVLSNDYLPMLSTPEILDRAFVESLDRSMLNVSP